MNESAKQQNIWQIPPADLVLEKEEVHIWIVELAQENIWECEQIISADEQARANRFRFEKDRDRFIIGRGILRNILSKYLDINPNQIRFSYNQYGKPSITGDTELKFNLSHSDNLALYAFCLNREIGIDIEQVKSDFIDDGMISLCLTEKEKAHFYFLSEDERTAFFFNCWTKKEAFLKANGFGLSVSPNEIETSELSKFNIFLPQIPLIDSCASALVIEGKALQIKFWQNY